MPTWSAFIPASPPSSIRAALPAFVAEPAKTRVYAFLSSYLVGGLEGHYYPNLYSPECIDVDATVKAADANRDLVRGIKGHAEIGGFARWGIKVIQLSAEIGRKTSLPVYVHFGQLWGLPRSGANGEDADTILERVIPLLQPGDILAHPFTRHPGGFVDRNGKVHEVIRAALDRRLKVDVGHGSHFSYRIARKALDAGIVPHTLGADMHGYNTYVPPPPGTPAEHSDDEAHPFAGQAKFSLTQAMSSMLALGLSLEQVVPMVTSNAADMLGLSDEIGALRSGMIADVSVLSDECGRFLLQDNEKTQVVAERLLQPLFCLRAAGAMTRTPRSCRRRSPPKVTRMKAEGRGTSRALLVLGGSSTDQKSMPPIPPPGGMAGAGVCFFGASATIASVVTSRPATEAASCSAARTTLAGSTMPLSTRST